MKRAKLSMLFLLAIFLIPIFHVAVSGQTPYRFDKFKAPKSDDEKRRLEYFANELRRDSSRTGYIIVYGRRGAASEAKKRAANAKHYLLTKMLTGNPNPVVTIDTCTRPVVEYELWIVPKDQRSVFCSTLRSPCRDLCKQRIDTPQP